MSVTASILDSIQAFAKCAKCAEILWTEVSEHDQKAGCLCGGVQIENAIVTGDVDASFVSANMESILQGGPV